MAKRLIRITTGQLLKELENYSKTYLHFVLDDKTTRLLKPVSFADKKITSLDTKHHRIIINLSAIQEIWIEGEPIATE